MRYATIFALTSLAGANPLSRRADSRFAPGTVWDIVLQGQDGKPHTLAELKATNGTVLDIDLFDNDSQKDGTKGWIKELAQTKTVICYFSAGSFEDWRPDNGSFVKGVDYGKAMDDWPGEYWLNLTSQNVKDIMTARIIRAKNAGCHAIDPDNIDGYSEDKNGNKHQDGYNFGNQVYIDYIKFLSKTAKDNGMVMGLKNALEISGSVIDAVEFAVNEQCHETDPNDPSSTWDCPEYEPFTKAKKAVFNIEYHNDKTVYCKEPANVNLSTVLKPMGLDTIGGQC